MTFQILLTCPVAQSCLTLGNPPDCSSPGSSVHGIFQARIPEWVDISYSGDLLNPGIEPMSPVSPALAGRFFITEPHWNGIHNRLPSFFHCCCCCCEVASVMSDSVRPHRRQLTRLLYPWDSPGKNTGVGCHFLLQCMKVKSESEVVPKK